MEPHYQNRRGGGRNNQHQRNERERHGHEAGGHHENQRRRNQNQEAGQNHRDNQQRPVANRAAGGRDGNNGPWQIQNQQQLRGRQGNGAGGHQENRRRGNENQEARQNHRANQQRPGANRGSGTEQQVRHLGYKAVEALLEKEPSEVVITLASHSGLGELLSLITMKPNFVELLCKVICRACSSKLDRQSIQHLLGRIKSSYFLSACLPQYVVGMMTDHIQERRQSYPEHISNILRLLQELMSIFPASTIAETSMLISLIPGSINALRTSGVEIEEQIEQSLERVSDLARHLQDKKREGTLRVDTHITIDTEIPAEDYRRMSVYPSYNEIHHGEKPFLRPNTLNSKYESTVLYLDTHFRLLREDFVRPLRDGIQELLMYHDHGSHRRKCDDIRIYFDTRILSPLCTPLGIVYKVQFDVTPLKMVRWQNSKRLLYGSLVCLSKDSFETFLFATVANRDAAELAYGEVQLQFSEQSRGLLAQTQPNDSFLMVETTAYFEACRHVLEGLQEMNDQDVPFQKYIVECQKEVRSPRYLDMGISYDISCLLAENINKASIKKNINILESREWPSMDVFGFDESQMEAVQLALTKELAIIQGPPGTGKTYVGLKIARALLSNTNAWQFEVRSYPVLVVCYTNHALDQFLEGIQQFLGKGIVRVGGRSNSEVLKKFTLRELRSSPDFRRNSPPHLRRAYFEIKQSMQESEQKLQEGSQLLHCSISGIIHERFLENYIKEEHWDSLHSIVEHDDFCFQKSRGKPSAIVEWLALGVIPYARTPDLNGAGAQPQDLQEEEEEEEEEEGEEDKLIDIAEEADIIQADRVLDGDEEAKRPKKRKETNNGRELADFILAMSFENNDQSKETVETGNWEMTKKQKKKRKRKVKNELKKLDAMTAEEAAKVTDVWNLNINSRWRLYRLWLQRYQQGIRQKILSHEEKYQEHADRLAELRLQEDLVILKQAQVIGMTTTGAAKYRKLLQVVEPRIVIVEEAAEVLEAHIITTLSSACQHLILIGDHQQLRPSANVYDLAKNFNLEVSMFERLIKSNLPFVRLNYQHRMRPEIARLLTPHIYKELDNHPSVLNYENIKGVSTNLFFVEHNCLEKEIQDGKSHENMHEAMFIVELCKYFLCQEYKPSQITILTTYTGQLFCLRKLMPAKKFSGVKVHVVDKYQGEENDIILLSLVRSNKEGRVGFLHIANRICVALSRAKKGLFCIGNMGMLGKVNLWSSIILTLRQRHQIGNHLMLCCQNHPEVSTPVRTADDFKNVPEGGCTKDCEFRLDCGHRCTRVCHPYDPEHKEYQCNKPCQKELCEDGHRCKKMCFQPCGPCMKLVSKNMPLCGHQQMVPCSIPVRTYCCEMPCTKFLSCGHRCVKLCGDECEERCTQDVEAELKCGHIQTIKCWKKRDIEFGMPVKCNEPCRTTLNCEHKCSGSCHSCTQGRFHETCRHPCKRPLICSHPCQEPCTNKCPPCIRICENRCIHSQCKKKCGERCAPCMEPCEWKCEHYKCGKLCSEPCDRPPCDVACPKKLKCGHRCIGLCGEPCPSKCRTCNKDEITQIFFGNEDESDACFIELEDCGHIFERSGMDQYVTTDITSQEEMSIKLKVCPKCQTPIRKNLRYGTFINRTLDEIEQVKKKILGPEYERKETQQRLKDSLQQMVEFRRTHSVEYLDMKLALENPDISLRELLKLENMSLFYQKIAKLFSNIQKVDEKEKSQLKNRLLEIKEWVGRTRSSFTEQEVLDLQNELGRFIFLLELLVRCKMAGRISPANQNEIELLRKILERNKRFTQEDVQLVKVKLKELEKNLPHSGLGISDNERIMIVKAMELQQGHWFKCPNNHVYVITECGGATERSKCPECNETIGGTHHNLHHTNRLAPEMDGARHAAWSNTANNMMNFEELQRELGNFELD
ncbi:NFX1-type zinc finger-containing protein 1 [Xenopus laevis]|uniref:NFX1-type zinc finger-containing protein 1 n=2 Tax=Xenopus laevis TaxID=8355 RepID=A0A1L8ETZ7_XENLA|nr:NFX1-type zinc finger-containing protein 1 [Xenopus laevis]OCT62801.1 hypothetical protein XELAEV_18043892mg [Xenopus laevis]